MTGRSGAGRWPAPLPPGRWLGLEDRLEAARPRTAIGRALGRWGAATSAGVGAALGMPTGEAIALVGRTSWREGDIAALRAVAAKLGIGDAPG